MVDDGDNFKSIVSLVGPWTGNKPSTYEEKEKLPSKVAVNEQPNHKLSYITPFYCLQSPPAGLQRAPWVPAQKPSTLCGTCNLVIN